MRIRLAALALVLALATGAAVLAGRGGVGSSLDPVAAAATKSTAAATADVTMSITLSSPDLAGGRPLDVSGTGQLDGSDGTLSFDMSKLLTAAGAPAGTDGSMTETFIGDGGDEVLYLRMGMLDGKIPGGKHWLKIDLSQASSALGLDLSQLGGGVAGQDPAQILAALGAVGGKVENLGTETIDGEQTTHYRATIDLAKAAALAGASSPALQQLEQQSGLTTIPVDVWIGSDGYVRRLSMSFDVKTQSTPVHMAMTMGWTNYGTTVHVEAPSSSDVLDVTALAAKALKGVVTNP